MVDLNAALQNAIQQRGSMMDDLNNTMLKPQVGVLDQAAALPSAAPSYSWLGAPTQPLSDPASAGGVSDWGQGLLGVGAKVGTGILNGLDTILGKPLSAALAFGAEAVHNPIRQILGEHQYVSPWAQAGSVFTNNRGAAADSVNNLLGDLGAHLAGKTYDPSSLPQGSVSQFWSPGNLADLATGIFGPGELGKVGTAIAKDALLSNVVKAGQAQQGIRDALTPEAEASTAANEAAATSEPASAAVNTPETSLVPAEQSATEHAALPSGWTTTFEPSQTLTLGDAKPVPYTPSLEEVLKQGAGSQRSTPLRNYVDGEFTPIVDDPNNAEAVKAATDAGHINMPEQALRDMPDLSHLDEANQLFGQHKASAFDNVLNKAGFGSGLDLMSPELRNLWVNSLAEAENGRNTIGQFGVNMAKAINDAGLSGDLENLRHAYEMSGESHPALDALLNPLQEGLQGTKAGLNNLNDYGIAPKTLRENYIPITLSKQGFLQKLMKGYKTPPKDTSEALNLGRNLTGQTYNLDREFPTAANARAAGYKVDNTVSSVIKTLMNHHNDASKIDMLQKVRDLGLKTGEVSNTPAEGLKLFQSGDKLNPLNGKYLSNGLHQAVTTEFERTPLAHANIPLVSPALRGYDKLLNLVRGLSMYMPGPHQHNVFGNAMLGFGLHPSTYMDAEAALKGSGEGASQAMQRSRELAQQTGALHNDGFHDIESAIGRSLQGKNPEGLYTRFQDAALWNREKALRLGVFHDAIQQGMARGLSEPEAANLARDVTNKHMIDYSRNNLSTFEREVMSRLDPFYKWHKGNYPLQFSRLVDPAAMGRYAGYRNALNSMQRQMTGNDTTDNLGGGKEEMKLQIPIGNGNAISFDPYMPQDEALKALMEPGANFAYNRLASPLRELSAQLTNRKYYPNDLVTPDDRKYMSSDKYTVSNPSDSAGKQMLDRLAHAVEGTVLPSDQPATTFLQSLNQTIGGGNVSDREVPALDKLLLSLSGGFPASSPISQNKLDAQNYLEQMFLANNALNAYKQQHSGEKVPTYMNKQIAHQYGVKSVH